VSLADADLVDAKRRMRVDAQARREAAYAATGDSGAAAAQALRDHALAALGAVLAVPRRFTAFSPVGSEINVMPLYEALVAQGHTGGLPVVPGRGRPLRFHGWRPGDPLAAGVMGIPIPLATAPELDPDLLLVPLLAFDRAGYRLGYGGGFYDRTLAALRARREVLAVGVAFAAQEVPEVPHGPGDQRIDWVVTERAAISVGR